MTPLLTRIRHLGVEAPSVRDVFWTLVSLLSGLIVFLWVWSR